MDIRSLKNNPMVKSYKKYDHSASVEFKDGLMVRMHSLFNGLVMVTMYHSDLDFLKEAAKRFERLLNPDYEIDWSDAMGTYKLVGTTGTRNKS